MTTWLLETLLDMDLSKDSLYHEVYLRTQYESKVGITNHHTKTVEDDPFTVSHSQKNEYSIVGSLREQLFKTFTRLRVYKYTGLNWQEWIKQPAYELYHQIDLLPKLIEESLNIDPNALFDEDET